MAVEKKNSKKDGFREKHSKASSFSDKHLKLKQNSFKSVKQSPKAGSKDLRKSGTRENLKNPKTVSRRTVSRREEGMFTPQKKRQRPDISDNTTQPQKQRRIGKPSTSPGQAKSDPKKENRKKTELKEAVLKWEKLRRHDTKPEERASLVADVLAKAEGRVAQIATSPTGSRVLQACTKHGSPEQRHLLLKEAMPELMKLSQSPYGHKLICKLVATGTKADTAAFLAGFKGHVAALLRHPCGAAVVDELYNEASAAQRNHLAAEFYGKEYVLLSQEEAPAHLGELLTAVDATKRRLILQRLAISLTPIMEKGLVDPVLSHRLLAEYLQHSSGTARAEAMELLAGEPLLRMVHTRDGAWAANSVLTHGSAKDCKKFIKAMKGRVEVMAKDRWGSLVLAAAVSHVDDTVLLRKIVLSALQSNLEELMGDRHARLIFLQLLAPDRPRYLQAELHAVVHPAMHTAAKPSQEGEEAVGGKRKKDSSARLAEILGQGEGSFGAALLETAQAHLAAFLQSSTASDVAVELATGAVKGVLGQSHQQELKSLQAAVADLVASDEAGAILGTVYGSRAVRRMLLASGQPEYSSAVTEPLVASLGKSLETKPAAKEGHAKKVADALKKIRLAGR